MQSFDWCIKFLRELQFFYAKVQSTEKDRSIKRGKMHWTPSKPGTNENASHNLVIQPYTLRCTNEAKPGKSTEFD